MRSVCMYPSIGHASSLGPIGSIGSPEIMSEPGVLQVRASPGEGLGEGPIGWQISGSKFQSSNSNSRELELTK